MAKLDDNSFKSLLRTLQDIPISLGTDEFVKKAKISNDKYAYDVENILTSIGSLASIGERGKPFSRDLANEVVSLISKGEIKALRSSSEKELQILKERIEELLKIESMYYSAKAVDVLTEHEHVFGSARILTDCRPVFGRKVDSDLTATVIFHMLQIHYHQNGEHKEIYFALDQSDLIQLKEVIQRAEEKVKTIKKSFLNPAIKILE